MAITELQTRIALKYDTYENWTSESKSGKDLVLLKGEIGIVEIAAEDQGSSVQPTVLFKVGDGTKKFSELPWASAKAADVYGWAKKSEADFITWLNETAKFATDAELAAVKDTLEAKDTELANRISELEEITTGGSGSIQEQITAAVAAETEARVAADNAINAKFGEGIGTGTDQKTVAAAIAAAQTAAEEKATEVATNLTNYIGTNDAAVAAVDQKADAEKTRAEDAEKALGERIDGVIEAYGNADTAINDKIGGSFDATNTVAKAIEAAEKAGTDAAKAVDELSKGQVATNIADIAENAQAISTETSARTEADTALGERIDTLAGKLANVTNVMNFVGTRTVTVTEGSDGTPDTISVIKAEGDKDFRNGDVVVNGEGKEFVFDGTTWHEFGFADANTSAIAGLTTRIGTAETDIDNAQAAITDLQTTRLVSTEFTNWKTNHENDHAKTATEITAEIASAVAVEKSRAEGAEKAINDKIGGNYTTTDTVAKAIEAAAKAGTDADAKAVAVAGRMDTAETNIKTLQDITAGYSAASTIKSAVEAAAALGQQGIDDASAAQEAADKAQGEVDALELVVNDNTTGLAAAHTKAAQNAADIADVKAVTDAYTARFGDAATLLIFQCGSSTVNTEAPATA